MFKLSLVVGLILTTPQTAFAAPVGLPHLTNHWLGFTTLLVFTAAYAFVISEEATNLRKSKPMVVAAGILWLLIGIVYSRLGLKQEAAEAFRHVIRPDALSQPAGQRLRYAMTRDRAEVLAVIKKQASKFGPAEGVRLIQDRVEHRPKVAGRRIDDLHYLGDRGLPLKRLVTLSLALGKLTLQIGYELLGIG
jgi:hypothetical protein